MESLNKLPFDSIAEEVINALDTDKKLLDLAVQGEKESKKETAGKRREMLDEITIQMGALFEEEGFNGDEIQVDAFVADTRNYLATGGGLKTLNEIYQYARGGDQRKTEELLRDLYAKLREDFEKSFNDEEAEMTWAESTPEVIHGVVGSTRSKVEGAARAANDNAKMEKKGLELDAATKRKLGMQSAPTTGLLGTNSTPINGVSAGVFKTDKRRSNKGSKDQSHRRKAS